MGSWQLTKGAFSLGRHLNRATFRQSPPLDENSTNRTQMNVSLHGWVWDFNTKIEFSHTEITSKHEHRIYHTLLTSLLITPHLETPFITNLKTPEITGSSSEILTQFSCHEINQNYLIVLNKLQIDRHFATKFHIFLV